MKRPRFQRRRSAEAHPGPSSLLIGSLQHHAGLRSTTYLASMVAAALLARQVQRLYLPSSAMIDRRLALHLTALPLVVIGTAVFVRLRPEDYAGWQRLTLRQGLGHAALGGGLATAAALTVIGIAWTQGWVGLGDGDVLPSDQHTLRATLLIQLANVAVAFNEEMVFRGYGLETLTESTGRPLAIAILTPLFALWHGPGWMVFWGQSALGLAMTTLRLGSGSLWLPFGYHFTWNYLQTAILGDPRFFTSLYPVPLTGPTLWVGQIEPPTPALLDLLVHLSIALVGGLFIWRRARRTHS